MPIDSKAETELLLLVEGVNDCHAVFHLITLLRGNEPNFGIHECGGAEGVLESLSGRVIATTPKQKILGVLLDTDVEGLGADQVVEARRQQIDSRLGDFYNVPADFPEDGLIIRPRLERPDRDRLPIVGVWLMPNNRSLGMLEDLLSASLSSKTRDYTSSIVSKAKEDKIAKFQEIHHSKAVIRTYMAWQDPPDTQFIGIAIRNHIFTDAEESCGPFCKWLENLFGYEDKAG